MAIVLPALDTRNTLAVIALSRDGEFCKLQREVALLHRHMHYSRVISLLGDAETSFISSSFFHYKAIFRRIIFLATYLTLQWSLVIWMPPDLTLKNSEFRPQRSHYWLISTCSISEPTTIILFQSHIWKIFFVPAFQVIVVDITVLFLLQW
jgi:hypothetical protein